MNNELVNVSTYIIVGDRCIRIEHMLPRLMRNLYMKIAKEQHLSLWIFQTKEKDNFSDKQSDEAEGVCTLEYYAEAEA